MCCLYSLTISIIEITFQPGHVFLLYFIQSSVSFLFRFFPSFFHISCLFSSLLLTSLSSSLSSFPIFPLLIIHIFSPSSVYRFASIFLLFLLPASYSFLLLLFSPFASLLSTFQFVHNFLSLYTFWRL